MSTTIVSLCIVDAAVNFHPTASEWRSALESVPEQRERSKITSYKPPSTVQLFEHYNPRSVMLGRHLLRGMLALAEASAASSTKEQQQQQQQSSSSSSSSCVVLKSGPNVECRCCGKHVTPLLRSFEGRPCVASEPCNCKNSPLPPPSSSSPFIEDRPNVNLSHNNGVVAVGMIPSMSAASDASSAGGGYVLGVDVMCVDTVPTALRNGELRDQDDDHDDAANKGKKTKPCGGLDQYFTPEEVDEFIELMHPYMTQKEWGWINDANRTKKRDQSPTEKQRQFAKHFYTSFEGRRKHCYPPDDDASPSSSGSGQFLADPRNIANLYRLWRFLVLWTIKEAVLKAAGIGLGFDTTTIEIGFVSSLIDIDDAAFYSSTVSVDKESTTSSSALMTPLSNVQITVSVPRTGIEPGGVFGPSFFHAWLVWDQRCMSVTAAVLAPAFVSKWSGQARFVMRSAIDVSSSCGERSTDELEEEHNAKVRSWISAVRESIEQQQRSDVAAAAVPVLRLMDVAFAPGGNVHGLPLGSPSVAAGKKRDAENGICCGCCVSKRLLF